MSWVQNLKARNFQRYNMENKIRNRIKYMKGENSWDGRGKTPAWLKEHLANGGTLEEITVKFKPQNKK